MRLIVGFLELNWPIVVILGGCCADYGRENGVEEVVMWSIEWWDVAYVGGAESGNFIIPATRLLPFSASLALIKLISTPQPDFTLYQECGSLPFNFGR